MDDQKRVILAIFLSLFVFLFYWQRVLAPYERQAAQQTQGASASSVSSETSATNTTSSTGATTTQAAILEKVPNASELNSEGTFSIETARTVTDFSLLGGRITKLLLKEHRLERNSNELLDVVHGHDQMPYPLGALAGTVSDVSIKYSAIDDSGNKIAPGTRIIAPNDREFTIRFSGKHTSGLSFEKTIKFLPGSYLFGVEAKVDGTSEPVWLEWSRYVPVDDPELRLNEKDIIVLTDGKSRHQVQSQKIVEGITPLGVSPWVCFSDKYFMASIVPSKGELSEARADRRNEFLFARAKGSSSSNEFKVYAGPKDYDTLQAIGFSLDRTIDLGLFSFLAHPILLLLRFFYSLLGNWGLAIVLLTLTLKLAFLPLTRASFASMQKMQEIQPEVKALRERIDDPTQLNQELMGLYKKRGVNPMGGCFPVLIQIPVFLGLYNALLNALELRHAPFALWINDLSTPENLVVLGIPLPIMILIMGASMFVQQLTTPSAMDPQQKKIFMMMPVMFTIMFIVFPMPSGLVLYWLVNNLISIVQQMYLRSDKGVSPLQATLLSSIAIFGFTFVLTLL